MDIEDAQEDGEARPAGSWMADDAVRRREDGVPAGSPAQDREKPALNGPDQGGVPARPRAN
jgi:hypothetical protein